MCSKHNIRIIGPGRNNLEFAAIGNVLAMEGSLDFEWQTCKLSLCPKNGAYFVTPSAFRIFGKIIVVHLRRCTKPRQEKIEKERAKWAQMILRKAEALFGNLPARIKSMCPPKTTLDIFCNYKYQHWMYLAIMLRHKNSSAKLFYQFPRSQRYHDF